MHLHCPNDMWAATYTQEYNAVSFIVYIAICSNTENKYCWWALHVTWRQLQSHPVFVSDVWRPAGTLCTWRRRWKGWYSCWRPAVQRRSGRTSQRSRQGSRESSQRTWFQSVSNRWRIRSRPSVTWSVRCARLRLPRFWDRTKTHGLYQFIICQRGLADYGT